MKHPKETSLTWYSKSIIIRKVSIEEMRGSYEDY